MLGLHWWSHGPIWWVIVGLAAGALAKAFTPNSPGKPQGCVMTTLFGIAGSVIVGVILHGILHEETSGSLIGSIIGATIGAVLLITLVQRSSR